MRLGMKTALPEANSVPVESLGRVGQETWLQALRNVQYEHSEVAPPV
jgi:hypothetical protein